MPKENKQTEQNNILIAYDTIHDVINTYLQDVNITLVLGLLEAIKIDLTVDALSQLLNNPDKLTDNNNLTSDND